MTVAAGSTQYRAGELAADRVIHIIGTLVGVVGSAILVGIAAPTADRQVFCASVVYSFCLLTMLACSAAYHLVSNPSRRKSLRQLDHAAIFLMIAGTYTPFTTCRLHGVGDRDDRRGLGGSRHGSRVEADPPTLCRASFDRCLPGAGLDDLGGDATYSSLGRRSDGGSYRGWRRAVFHRGRFSRLAGAALPEGYLARLRAGRGLLPLRSYFAWRGVGPIVTAIATI